MLNSSTNKAEITCMARTLRSGAGIRSSVRERSGGAETDAAIPPPLVLDLVDRQGRRLRGVGEVGPTAGLPVDALYDDHAETPVRRRWRRDGQAPNQARR